LIGVIPGKGEVQMSRRQYLAMLAVVAVAACVGGAVMELVLHASPATAQASAPRELKAQSFVLVNNAGNTCGSFTLKNGLVRPQQ
jgi:negative regulator of sigma E activity